MVKFLMRESRRRTEDPSDGRRLRYLSSPRTARRYRHGLSVVVLLSIVGLLASDFGGGTRLASATRNVDPPSAFTVSACCGFGSVSYNVFNANAIGLAANWVLMPLAVENYPSLSKFTPALARSWSLRGRQLTVDLRRGVNWQNGEAVTSKDLYDTVLLDGTDGAPLWNDITGVAAPSAHAVVFTLRPGEPAVLAEDDILSTYVVPSAVYGRFATTALKSDEVAYYAKDVSNPAAAATMPQYKAMGDVFTKLAAYPVKTLIGDGPYQLKNVTTNEASLVKWSGYYRAKNVHVDTVHYYDEANQLVYPLLTTGVLQFTSVELPAALLAKWRATPDAHVVANPSAGLVMPFNDSQYPLNKVQVRQALAYVIPREVASVDAYGTARGAAGVAEATPDGLPPTIQDTYLSKPEVKKLKRYPVNDRKAAALLKSAGFHKSGDRWITPQGKAFSLTLYAESGASDVTTAYVAMEKALDAFGVKTTVQSIESSTLSGDLLTGNFSAGFDEAGGANPLQIFASMLGPSENFPSLGSDAGKKGLGFGPTENVPGLGHVNVADTIAKEEATTPPGPTMRKLVWDWARLVNTDVPYLWYATKIYQLSYSTKEFTDWPPAKSELWKIMTFDRDNGLVEAITQGYVRPRS